MTPAIARLPHQENSSFEHPTGARSLPHRSSEDGLALRLVDEAAGRVRWVQAWGHWMLWDGQCWVEDMKLEMINRARKVARTAAREHGLPSDDAAILSRKTIAAIEALARSDPRVAAIPEQWDRDPWLLNTPTGVVELRTGALRPPQPEDYMTKVTAVGPGGECPIFKTFLERVTGGDESLVEFIQRMCGYCLTGDTSEQALFFLFGHGANGKSVLLSTVLGLLGDYATTSAMETFTTANFDSHPTGLAALRGARLVTATETEEGRRWAETRIKTLTGGDRISARFMRQDYFEFTPHFKLLIAGNHKPSLRSVDDAIRRRFHLVPFGITIPPEERDPHLTDKLRAEWPGILKWMIEGCRKWQAEGLPQPRAVADATAEYLEDEDALLAWINERCDCDATASLKTADLFASWSLWARLSGEQAGTRRSFAQALKAHGFQVTHGRDGSRCRGLLLRRPDEQ